MSDINEKISQFKQEYEKLRNLMLEKGKLALMQAVKEVFDSNPKIQSIWWTQYIPYFNDGDVCEFRVNTPSFTNIDYESDDADDMYGGDYDGENDDVMCVSYDFEHEIFDDPSVAQTFKDFISSTEAEEILKNLFGEHAEVCLTREGFHSEYYEHD